MKYYRKEIHISYILPKVLEDIMERQFETYRSFFTNEAIIKSAGGNYQMLREEEEEDNDDSDSDS